MLIGSLSEIFFCCTNCMINVPVNVFVTDAIRWYTSVVIGACVAIFATPYAVIQVPFGLRTPTTAPCAPEAVNAADAAASRGLDNEAGSFSVDAAVG